jgi:hypothetical protein
MIQTPGKKLKPPLDKTLEKKGERAQNPKIKSTFRPAVLFGRQDILIDNADRATNRPATSLKA